MEPVIVSAIISGSAVALCGLFTVTMAFRQRRLEAELKRQVDLDVQRARGEIERELKAEEARLRVAAEFRLRMLDRVVGDVAAFRSALNAAVGSISVLAQEVAPSGATEKSHEILRAAHQAFANLPASGPFMPPQLLVAGTSIANEFHDCLKDVVRWSALPKPERVEACRATFDRMEEISNRSKELFGAWQSQQFARFEGVLERLDGIGPIELSETATHA